MNREQRRKSGVKTKEPVLNIRACDIKRMKDEAARVRDNRISEEMK